MMIAMRDAGDVTGGEDLAAWVTQFFAKPELRADVGQILGKTDEQISELVETSAGWCRADSERDPLLAHLASIDADHPDYQQEWKP